MVVWRGFGGVGLGLPLLGLVIGLGLAGSLPVAEGSSVASLWFAVLGGLGLLFGGTGAWLLGNRLNQASPQVKLQEHIHARAATYEKLINVGQFTRGPHFPWPASSDDAHHQAQAQLQQDEAVLRKMLFNQHTVYGIPMQYAGIGLAVAGGILAVVGSAAMTL
ncbi:MAG: hypothetical protein ACK5KO_07825 [Arachnia sp.]